MDRVEPFGAYVEIEERDADAYRVTGPFLPDHPEFATPVVEPSLSEALALARARLALARMGGLPIEDPAILIH